MPFVPNTPESYLSRNDSLPAETTCRGITSNGKPCRRPLAASNTGSPAPKHSGKTKKKKKNDAVTEEMYCWQHKEQAAHHSAQPSSPSPGKEAVSGKRTSIDTLADRLGLMGVDSEVGARRRRREENRKKSKRGGTRTLLCCFCFTIPIEEVPMARPQPRPAAQKVGGGNTSTLPTTPTKTHPGVGPARFSHGPNPSPSSNGRGKSPGKNKAGNYLSYIPPSTDPQTASLLTAELAKPFVESEEPGYIYMFWMTPASSSSSRGPAPVDAARQFLAPPPSASSSGSPRRASDRHRLASDAVSSYYGNPAGNAGEKKATMLLKIGRAANVQRRMNQWSRQCDYDVEVLRFYPYIPSSERGAAANNSPALRPEAKGVPRMTPHVRKVERLVHLELQGMGLRAELGTCAACGKEHREWFKVGATRGEVRVVDEVIRRWVRWDEGTV